ncbi:unnamed protein product [Lota lota]
MVRFCRVGLEVELVQLLKVAVVWRVRFCRVGLEVELVQLLKVALVWRGGASELCGEAGPQQDVLQVPSIG